MSDDLPKAGGFEAEKLLEAWLLKNGFHDVDRRRGATGLAVVERDGEMHIYSQKRDYFGCIDVSATSDDVLWLIQVTTKAGLSKRRRKVSLVRWPLKPVLAGHVRVSIFVHDIAVDAKGHHQHSWTVEDYRPALEHKGDWGFHDDEYAWSFVRAGRYQFKMADLARPPAPPLDEAIKAEARRIAALPLAEREAAMEVVAADRKAKRRAERRGKK